MSSPVRSLLILLCFLACVAPVRAAPWPTPMDGTYVVPDFRFISGETMKDLRLHYVTLGSPHRDAAGHVDNAVLILHGTGGDTNQFLREQFAGVLFVPGGLLDPSKYFIVITDGIGHGKSSKPSDGLHANFPNYGYRDLVRAQHDVLVDGLHVDHLRLVMGTSMGGMQTWLWGETYPAMMDALLPLASLPVQIGGRNRVWRDMIVDDLRNDPGYNGGDYTAQPNGLKAAVDMLWVFGSAPLYNQSQFPSRDQADVYYENTVKRNVARYDANNMIYQFESSRDYDPQPDLGKITAPLLAINSADDQINPPELGIVEREIKAVRHGRFLLLPVGDDTRGHGTHTLANVWGHHLGELLATRIDVRLPLGRDGRTELESGVTVVLPAGWLADTNPEGIHEYRYRLRPPAGSEAIDIVLSGAHFGSDPPDVAGRPLCINGLRGHLDEAAYGSTALDVSLGEAGLVHYAWMRYRTGDRAAQEIAHSLRAAGRSRRC